ncbi:hypothetical protein PTSG_00623 [Salpingoeca rosetta]|uniref:Protein kish n=1 Tax=Salpingoeca rosetta (strain ATCC 50818 / BSB-021) TaxID=946362 RepID=F2TX05_SALR5|nr:uncharacterized protein PTSG_00623 [Salpingoeca rosetta]EGD75914.1 hypothetical protein PTSG_00623 [Salpingoeca rosetta]|eukprot:XP_004998090.1 hypothetical protein PTSG_00623 [Salpingoeca rosetta]
MALEDPLKAPSSSSIEAPHCQSDKPLAPDCDAVDPKVVAVLVLPPLPLLNMSALFNFQSLLQVILLLICACAYARAFAPKFMDGLRNGPASLLWKFARIGERASEYVALACALMGVAILVWG